MHEKKEELLETLLKAQKQVDAVEAEIKALQPDLESANDAYKAAETALLEFMDDANEKEFVNERFQVKVIKKETLRVSIPADKKEEAMQWIEEDCGRGDMIKREPAIHNKTLSSFIGELVKDAKNVPSDLFNLFFQREIDIKPRKK